MTLVRIPNRIVEVRVGLPGAQGTSFAFPLRVEATAEHTSGRLPNKIKVTLYNLSEDSIRKLEVPGTVVQAFAGEDVPGLLGRGDVAVKGVRTKIAPPNRVTSLEAGDGRRRWRESELSKSWPPNTTLNQILNEAIVAFGVPRGFVSPRLPLTTKFASGYAWLGRVRDLLDDILAPHSAEWTLKDGQIDILMPGDALPGNAVFLSPSTGLVGAAERTSKGVNFTSLLNPQIRPGKGIQLDSFAAKGLFRVSKVSHKVDSRGIIWETKGEAVTL